MGYPGVVKVLLGWSDINPNTPAFGGLAPLGWAAWDGYEGVVEVLFRPSDVNPNEPGGDCETPLRHAATAGHKGVVEILVVGVASTPANQVTMAEHYSGGVVRHGRAGMVTPLRHHPPCSLRIWILSTIPHNHTNSRTISAAPISSLLSFQLSLLTVQNPALF